MFKLRHPRALIFGLLLLLAQAMAAAHAIGHGVGVDQGDPATPACEWCAAFGQLGAALPGAATPEASPSTPLHCGVYVARFFVPPLRLAFQAQAPPLFS